MEEKEGIGNKRRKEGKKIGCHKIVNIARNNSCNLDLLTHLWPNELRLKFINLTENENNKTSI